MYIDTHCHIYSSEYDDLDFVINEIKKSGIKKIILNGCDIESNKDILDLVKKYDIVYGAIGFHPTELVDFNEKYFEWLEEHINDEKIVAIGEIGLDYHYDNIDKNIQKKVFKKQLGIAEKYNKPVIIHARDAIKDTFDIISMYNLKGSMHCFSGSFEMAQEFIKKGFYIGIGGVLTYKNAKNLKNIVKKIGIENILLETDSPYLTPEPFRGKKNSSVFLPYIAKEISEICEVDLKKVIKKTGENANKLFFY